MIRNEFKFLRCAGLQWGKLPKSITTKLVDRGTNNNRHRILRQNHHRHEILRRQSLHSLRCINHLRREISPWSSPRPLRHNSPILSHPQLLRWQRFRHQNQTTPPPRINRISLTFRQSRIPNPLPMLPSPISNLPENQHWMQERTGETDIDGSWTFERGWFVDGVVHLRWREAGGIGKYKEDNNGVCGKGEECGGV